MTIHHSEGLPLPPNDGGLAGANFLSAAHRVSVEGLDPLGPDFAKKISWLFDLISQKQLVIMSPATRKFVEDFEIFEWSREYPEGLRDRGVAFFPGDKYLHTDIASLEEQFISLRRAQERGDVLLTSMVCPTLSRVTPWCYRTVLSCIESKIEQRIEEVKRRCLKSLECSGEMVRASDLGEAVFGIIKGQPLETATQILRILIRTDREAGKGALRGVVEHMEELLRIAQSTQPDSAQQLSSFDRHLRKLGVAILEGKISFTRRDFEIRAKQILAEGHVDTYLAGDDAPGSSGRYRFASNWLQGRYEGQYCPTPFPSWQPFAKQESFEESFKIVTRARHHSYHSFGRLRMESRSIGGKPPLLREFFSECFEDVQLIRGDKIDIPPGRGIFASGAKLEKLFFPLEGDGDRVSGYANNENLWFRDVVGSMESCSTIFLRQWIGVSSITEPFRVGKERYYFIIDNDHFSGRYGCAYGIPASVVSSKLVPALYPVAGQPDRALDSGTLKLSVSDLIDATLDAGKLPLNLGNMSVLFGGMCNALPVGSAPVFSWEEQHGQDWRDVYGHVHWSLSVWPYREDRRRVEEFVRPLSAADWEIRTFAIAGQQLFEAIRHRYGAWKNDQTPGRERPPRMLCRMYDIHHELQKGGAHPDSDEEILLGVIERGDPTFSPIPVLNCHTLELSTNSGVVRFPRSGNGRGEVERALWDRHVVPLLYQEENGEAGEGPYELVFIGTRDIKKDRR